MKVFVSSTVYDLLDVRAEIRELLTELGATPLMSDESLSDFQILPNANSIETCLVNVDSADHFVIVLDRRYGPTLSAGGFGDISATHLEYRRAVAQNKPVHFFVRDRLEGDFAVWKKNKNKASPALAWVQDAKDHRLFEVLAEHVKLEKAAPRSNWYTPFSTSVALKAILRKRLDAAMLGERLVQEINANRFPLLNVENDCTYEQMAMQNILRFRVTLTNVGGAPAFNLTAEWEDRKNETDSAPSLLAPGQSIQMQTLLFLGGQHTGMESVLACRYQSALGVEVFERYRVGGRVEPGNVIFSGCNRLDQQLSRSKPISLKIAEEAT